MRRCLTDLHFLVTEVLFEPDKHMYGPLHQEMCRNAQAPAYGRDGKEIPDARPRRHIYMYPRGHFKTTIFTVAKCTQEILANPGIRILILSAKDEHAATMSDQIRSFFARNEKLAAMFAPWCAVREFDAKSEWTTPARAFFNITTKREPSIVAAGFKSKLASKHYDLVILDDPIDEDDTTELGRQEALSNFNKVVPLLDMGGRLVVVGTRYHYDDLYQRLMDTGTFTVHVRHALEVPGQRCARDECSRFTEPHDAADYKRGVPIAPTLFTRDELENRLKQYEADPKRGASMWWHQYMNIPFAPSDQKFKPEWFARVDDNMIPGQREPFGPLSKWIAVDTAWKDDEHPSGYDYTVLVVGGFDDHGRLYILDILRSKDWTMRRGCDAIITVMKAYGISRIITEKIGEVTFHTYLKDRCRQEGLPAILLTLKRGGGRGVKNKTERIMALQGYFEQGRIFFRKAGDNFENAVNEFTNLGRWTNDDIADAIAMFVDERVHVPAPRPQSDSNTWTAPVRPVTSEGAWRRAAFAFANDPLGRFGSEGPAMTESDMKDESITDWGRVAIRGVR